VILILPQARCGTIEVDPTHIQALQVAFIWFYVVQFIALSLMRVLDEHAVTHTAHCWQAASSWPIVNKMSIVHFTNL
jgi:hypothetical protein